MQPPVDVAQLGAPAQRILDPNSPPPLRQMAAKGIAPGLKPADAVTVLALLAESADAGLAAAASATLDKLPAPLLNGALSGDLQAGVIDVLAPRFAKNAPVMEKILHLPQIALPTLITIAAHASEDVAELMAQNEERLIEAPAIIEKLYLNRATRMSTADRMLELAVRNKLELTGIPAFKEAAAAIGEQLIAEATKEPMPEDLEFKATEKVAETIDIDLSQEDTHRINPETGEEEVDEKVLPLHKRIAEMTTSQKIRFAQITGKPAARMILLRDSDRRVATAAIKNPGIQEAEIVRISASRAAPEEVLRLVANDREWTRSHQVKVNLVSNPRCPFAFASKLIAHLRDHELKVLARSKNVTGAVVQAAKQQLHRKGIKI